MTMDLLKLDINQCPDKYYVPNAFKDTNKCDQRTSYVSMLFSIKCPVINEPNFEVLRVFPHKLIPVIIYLYLFQS